MKWKRSRKQNGNGDKNGHHSRDNDDMDDMMDYGDYTDDKDDGSDSNSIATNSDSE
jgi:hypothetical protein